MGYPLNDTGEFILDVFAPGVGMGRILYKVQDGREWGMSYSLRQSSPQLSRRQLLHQEERDCNKKTFYIMFSETFA